VAERRDQRIGRPAALAQAEAGGLDRGGAEIVLAVGDRAKIEAMKKRTLETVAKFASADKKEATLHFYEGYFTAPVYVVVLVDTTCPCTGYAQKHDGPIAAGYLMIAARAFGYGTAYLTDGIPEQVTREVLAIPTQYQRICITPIGVA